MTQAWSLEQRAGLLLARCLPLVELPGVGHGFSTRFAADGEEFDLGGAGRADPATAARRRRFCDAAGLSGKNPAILRQVHGDRLARIGETLATPPRADGVIAGADDPGEPVPAVRAADCVPILLADTSGRVVAAVHGGWRGAAAGIARRAVAALVGLGAAPADLRAALGPSIGPCCYRVGAEVAREVAGASGAGEGAITREAGAGRLLDLHAAHRLQLEQAGIPASSIFSAPWCTSCRPDLFFSYRRDGAGGGRQMACIGRTGLP